MTELLTRWGGGPNKRLKVSEIEEAEGVGDTDMGGASGAGSSKDGGVPGFFWEIPRAGGLDLGGVRVRRIVRIGASLGVLMGRVLIV